MSKAAHRAPPHAASQVADELEDLAPHDAHDPQNASEPPAVQRGWRMTNRQGVVLAGVLYLLVACLLYSPILPWDGAHVLDHAGHDPVQTVWYLEWVAWAIAHGANPLFTTHADVPRGVNLATNTSVPLLGALGAPTTWLLGPVATFNLLMRAGLAGSAFTMFLVLRRWTTWWPAAFLGGALFGFNSFTLQQSATHLHLVFLVVPPLLLWVLDELFVMQRHGARAMGAVLGLLAAAQWFVNDEILFGCVLFAVIGLAYLALRYPHQAAQRLRALLGGLGVALGLFAAVIAYPLWLLLEGPQHLIGPTQPRWVLSGFMEDLMGPLVPRVHETTRATAAVVRLEHPTQPILHWTSTAGYVGVPLVVILLVLLVAWRRETLVQFAGAMAAVAFVLSLGARLTVFGHRTAIPLPSAAFAHIPLLYEVLPERLTVFMWLFLAMLLGVGLDRSEHWIAARGTATGTGTALGGATSAARGGAPRVIDRARWTPRGGAALSATAAAVVAASFVPVGLNGPPRAASPIPHDTAASMVADHTAAGGVVLFLPYIRNFAAQPMLWQAQSAMAYRIVGGYFIIPDNSYSSTNFVHPSRGLKALLGAVPSVDPAQPPRRQPSIADAIGACQAVSPVLRDYHVDSVVLWPAPRTNLRIARATLATALGPVPLRRDGVWMWDQARTRLKGASACSSLARLGQQGRT